MISMKVVASGASGFLGTALVRNLRADGHEVLRLVRRQPRASDEVEWDPAGRRLDPAVVSGADAVVNLAGAGVGNHRWTASYKQEIRASRLDSTATIAAAITAAAQPPKVLLNASAVGFYGQTGEEAVDESASVGNGFLADVVCEWEAATAPAADAGSRVVAMRTGVVLAPDGGALGKVLPLFRLGLGGRLGNGLQWMSWIALPDYLVAVRFLLDKDISGPVNVTGPDPVRNREYTKAIGRALRRPTLAIVPSAALRAALGGFADEGVLVSQRVVPTRLEDAGFAFAFGDIDAALAAMLR